MEETRVLIERLVEKHLESLRNLTMRIRVLNGEMRLEEPSSGGAAATAHGLAHQIAGSAGSIGFGEVSIAARSLEEQLRLVVEKQQPLDEDRATLIKALVDRLESIVAAQRPSTSTLLTREFSYAQSQANIGLRR